MNETAARDNGSDDSLLQRGIAGDEEAFLALYRRHSDAVFRFALHMTGSRDTAEEVLQEVFLALLSNRGHYKGERGNLEAFLMGMTRNQIRRFLQTGRRHGSIVLPSSPTSEDDDAVEDELEFLRQAILALPENYRAVTVLCELEELSYVEAARRLGCAVGTVRSRLHRAKAILETKLRKRERCPTTSVRSIATVK